MQLPDPPPPDSPIYRRSLTQLCAWLTLVLCASALVGWQLELPLLRTAWPGRPAMTALTAWLFIGLALALLAARRALMDPQQAWPARIERGIIALVALAAGATLAQYLLKLPPTIELWLLGKEVTAELGRYPGRPAPQTAVLSLAIAASLLMVGSGLRRPRRWGHMLALATFAFNWFLLMGLFIGARGVFGLREAPPTGVSILTALSGLAITVGIVALRPDEGLPRLLMARSMASTGLRWLILAALVTPSALGIPLQGLASAGLLSEPTAEALTKGGEALVLTAFGLWFAIHLTRYQWEQERSLAKEVQLKLELARAANREAMLEANARFQTLYELSPVGLVVFELDGEIRGANTAFCHLFGCPPIEVVGMNLAALLGEAYRQRCDTLVSAGPGVPAGSSRRSDELVATTGEGARIHVEVDTAAVTIEGTPALMAAVRDVSERLSAAQALEEYTQRLKRSNEALDRFAHAASHDLKAPLRHIDALATWLAEDLGDDLPERSQQHLAKLQERVARMQALLKDLLKDAELSSPASRREVVDTRQAARTAFELVSAPQGFQLEIADEMPTLLTTRTPLEQCLRNLIDNAVRHHDRREGVVRVSAREVGDWIEFTVADDGPGIPAEITWKASEMFGGSENGKRWSPPGFGLTMIRKIIEDNGGHLTLEPSNGRGTTFRFTWPRGEPLPPPAEASQAPRDTV